MESREGLLISIIDTATVATVAFDQIDMLVADLLAGGDMRQICSRILYTTGDARGAVQHERRLAEDQQRELG